MPQASALSISFPKRRSRDFSPEKKARFLENQVVRGKRGGGCPSHSRNTVLSAGTASASGLPSCPLRHTQMLFACSGDAHASISLPEVSKTLQEGVSGVSWFLPRHMVSNSPIICITSRAAAGSRPAFATWHTHRY